MKTHAPFRADHVGSLLRPHSLKQARVAYTEGRLNAADLRAVEDIAITKAVRMQEEMGLHLATDGEYRRSWWHFDFLAGLQGVEVREADHGVRFQGTQPKRQGVFVTGKVAFNGHYMVDHFRFLQSVTKVTPKMTIPAPSVLHYRAGRDGIDASVYPDIEVFFADLATAYRGVIDGFYAAGCRYLQMDDTVWAYLCSQKARAEARQRGEDPDALQRAYAGVVKRALQGKPADLTVTTHVCRGNFRSTWIAEGGYEPVASVMLGELPYDGFFLEYDSERAGGFEPLRFLPKGEQRVVVGVVTSKFGELEDKDTIKRRLDEAARYVDPSQMCLSPQCGFASTEEGNLLSEEEQWRKLRLVAQVAREYWGD
jgi:5-methyltetrahydropteroyltriglutamate--homocysteine methyltransferase